MSEFYHSKVSCTHVKSGSVSNTILTAMEDHFSFYLILITIIHIQRKKKKKMLDGCGLPICIFWPVLGLVY